MNKITTIIKREYLERVRKKSFIIMTILGPLLMGALIVVPVLVSNLDEDKEKKIAVYDPSNTYYNILKDTTGFLNFEFVNSEQYKGIKDTLPKSGYDAVLSIDTVNQGNFAFMFNENISLSTKSYISNKLQKKIVLDKLKQNGTDANVLNIINTEVKLETKKWTAEGGEEKSLEALAFLGYFASLFIYMFIFMYGTQVMRGVIEEKTSRVIEIIISSVKPFELMMGKIIGIALVAITQFSLWVILSIIVTTAAKGAFMPNVDSFTQMSAMQNMPTELTVGIETIINLPWIWIVLSFLFYFIGGYLLYSSLFAAIGAAVDNEADTQQFMLPVTIPLILAIVLMTNVIQDPGGVIARWFSIIPFTSPVIMMVRIIHGVPNAVKLWEIALSMSLLIITFLGTTWLAGKIYRTGILMYGKKVNYQELWKWLKHKN